MMKPESKQTIAIEDLMRLKRAERPPTEFWSQFERELRAKQLAALMSRRPWWQRMPSLAPIFVRHRILIGATAVLAVTVVSLRNPRPSAVSVTDAKRVTAPVTGNGSSVVDDTSVSTRTSYAAVVMSERAAVVSDGDAGTAAMARVNVANVIAGSSDVIQFVEPQIGLTGPAVKTEAQTLMRRFDTTGVNVASMESGTSRVSGTTFEGRMPSTRTTVEPLHQMTSPSETRRTRLLTAMVSMASHEAGVRSTERVANRIDEERLYEQVSRFGARGDRLNVKF